MSGAALAHGAPMVHCSSVHAFDLARARPVLTAAGPRSNAVDRPLYDRSKAAGEEGPRRLVRDGLSAVN